MSEKFLKIQNITFGYQKPIIKIKEFDVTRNEIVSIVGKSGIGKSTIFKTISGLINPIDGQIFFEDIERPDDWRRQNVKLILQNFPLFHWHTIGNSLRLAAKIMGINLEEKELHKILEDLSATHLINKYPRDLSGGERCRASLAHAAISSPHLLLLDEPFSGLDVVMKDSIAKAIFSFAEKNKIPVIYIAHDLYDACAYADRVVIIAGDNVASIKDIIKVDNIEKAIREVHNQLKKYA